MQKLIISFIIIISSTLSALAAPGEAMPQCIAQGSASVTCEGIDGIFSNPAALGEEKNPLLFIGSQSYGLSLAGSCLAHIGEDGAFAARILASPDPAAFGGTDLLLWAGKSFSARDFQAGVAFSGFYSTAPGVKGRGAMMDTGLLWKGEQGKIGLLWRNVTGRENWQSAGYSSSYRPPFYLVLGLALEEEAFSGRVDLWTEGQIWHWQGGVSFPLFGLKISVGYDMAAPSVGLAADLGQKTVEYSWRGGQVPMVYLGLKFKL